MMTGLEELPTHLSKLKTEDWNKLFNLIPEMEATKKFGELIIDQKGKDGVFQFPYYANDEVVDRFIDIAYKLGIVPDFDWMDWKEGKKILNNAEQDFTKLDTITLCKLLTVIIRADRFNEGFLIQNFKSGVIPKIINALQKNTFPSLLE